MKRMNDDKTELFETMPVPRALLKMTLPTIISQLIMLIYNMADTWYIGRTNNPYMVAAASLVLTVYLISMAIANMFGVGGGTLAARLLGARREDEARRAASLSVILSGVMSLVFSALCASFMEPLLRLLGASDMTMGYAKEYLFYVVVIGAFPAVVSNTMATLLRDVGYSREAAMGLMFGGLLNMALDPLFMFVLLPPGREVAGAAVATMLSNVAALAYFVCVYRRVQSVSILRMPPRPERVESASLKAMFGVGVPAAMSMFLFDLTNMVINRLSSGYGDTAVAAIGIVLKVERLWLGTCVGICLGMVPLMAYNLSSKNIARMKAFFNAARVAGLAVSVTGLIVYYVFAEPVIGFFIAEPETVAYGVRFLRARCLDTPCMFLSFQLVHVMQAFGQGRVSFALAAIRQLALNIPLLFTFNALFGMTGVIWTQLTADSVNVLVSYVIYRVVCERVLPRGA